MRLGSSRGLRRRRARARRSAAIGRGDARLVGDRGPVAQPAARMHAAADIFRAAPVWVPVTGPAIGTENESAQARDGKDAPRSRPRSPGTNRPSSPPTAPRSACCWAPAPRSAPAAPRTASAPARWPTHRRSVKNISGDESSPLALFALVKKNRPLAGCTFAVPPGCHLGTPRQP